MDRYATIVNDPDDAGRVAPPEIGHTRTFEENWPWAC